MTSTRRNPASLVPPNHISDWPAQSMEPGDPPQLLSRSPHPYHRPGQSIKEPEEPLDDPESLDRLPSPLLTPSHSPNHTDTGGSHRSQQGSWPLNPSKTPNDSGTEADDEGIGLLKSLPPPPIKPKKGLRDGRSPDQTANLSPLLTPAYLSEAGKPFPGDLGDAFHPRHIGGSQDDDTRRAAEVFRKKRRREMTRRGLEVFLLAATGGICLHRKEVLKSTHAHRKELLSYLVTIAGTTLLYPLRLLRRSDRSLWAIKTRFRVPSAFDPATIIYPTLIPTCVAISLLPSNPSVLLPNLILSISSLPLRLIPSLGLENYQSASHWLLASIPLFTNQLFSNSSMPYQKGLEGLSHAQLARSDSEVLILLHPLHQALVPVLRYLTTTSLLPAELQLLSASLINILLYSSSPQAIILKSLIWGGGFGILLLCASVLRKGVALARIPLWRLRRAQNVVKATNAFLDRADHLLRGRSMTLSAIIGLRESKDSDADEDGPPGIKRHNTRACSSPATQAAVPDGIGNPTGLTNFGTLANGKPLPTRDGTEALTRSNTTGSIDSHAIHQPRQASQTRRTQRTTPSQLHRYLSMTPRQVKIRKWACAAYVYTVVLAIIFLGIDPYVGLNALNGNEPIGWAIGYLFGDIQWLRTFGETWRIDSWLCLPPLGRQENSCHQGWVEHSRRDTFGQANTRLAISLYCVCVLAVGMAIVIRLSTIVEVDTRRKVFHGIMVVMFLPVTFIDPTFAGLALMLILAIFLLLDLFRASQLPPLSKPLAHFLTPYVDGRDLRGPVVISPIFLLIGCAIPLWLSLAAVGRSGEGYWAGWDVPSRDISMVSGIICVGMGDAAASLIGRRYGRRKWPWTGGKSLEGSMAFALAVSLGILASKSWLWLGRWDGYHAAPWLVTLGKTIVASWGASLTEAVLTGGNDNVVVPVILWLLVRGLDI